MMCTTLYYKQQATMLICVQGWSFLKEVWQPYRSSDYRDIFMHPTNNGQLHICIYIITENIVTLLNSSIGMCFHRLTSSDVRCEWCTHHVPWYIDIPGHCLAISACMLGRTAKGTAMCLQTMVDRHALFTCPAKSQ